MLTYTNFQNFKGLVGNLQASQSKNVKVSIDQYASKISLSFGKKNLFCRTASNKEEGGGLAIQRWFELLKERQLQTENLQYTTMGTFPLGLYYKLTAKIPREVCSKA